MLAVRDRIDEFPHNTKVAVITFSAPEMVGAYVEHHKLDMPVLIDSDLACYKAYGLERGSKTRVWGWRSGWKYAQILWKHKSFEALQATDEDTLQLGGDFVVDAHGNLLYGFWGEGPDDRPTVTGLIKSLG